MARSSHRTRGRPGAVRRFHGGAHRAVVAFLLLEPRRGASLSRRRRSTSFLRPAARSSWPRTIASARSTCTRGLRGDALLLLDRLRQALDEALVAAHELDLAFAAELGAPALLVLAPVGDELLGLRLGGALRGLGLELLGERVVALPLGLGEEEGERLQVVVSWRCLVGGRIGDQAASTACRNARLSSRRAGSAMFCCSRRSIGSCRRTARSRSASWPGA